ncbi:pentapeptide repeat-containing protein [Rhizobium sp. XQZ8]|nr:pentapeptide repeat-containing protein [Rhizobium populisoli]
MGRRFTAIPAKVLSGFAFGIASKQNGAFQARILLALAALVWFAAAPASQAQNCRSDPGPSIDWRGCNKKTLMLDGSDFTRANLTGTDFSYTDLRHSIFAGADLTKGKMIRALLNNASADNAIFERVEGYRATLQDVRANGASFKSGELQRANFTGAQLRGANFEKADLSRAVFDKAVITGANFVYANLSRASLSSAVFEGSLDFKNAFFLFVRIEGVDLSQAENVTQQQLDMACGDNATKLPAGLTMPSQWPCPEEAKD